MAADVYEPGGTAFEFLLLAALLHAVERRRLAAGRMRGFQLRRSNSTSGKMSFERDEDAAADRGAALQLEPVDGREDVLALCVGGCTTAAVPANDTTPTRVSSRLVGDEGLGRGLRRGKPVRLDVGGAHAARHVHRQDDGLVLRRQHDDAPRPRDGDDHQRERDQEQQRRDVAPEALARAHRLLHHASGSHSERATFFLRRRSRSR